MATNGNPPEYLDARKVRERYGNRSAMWLWRMQTEPDFPKPIQLRNRNYWRLSDLIRFEARKQKGAQDAVAS